MSEVICPYCGTPNHPLEDLCKSCQKPLFAQPSWKSDAKDSSDSDWLNNLRGAKADQSDHQEDSAGKESSKSSDLPEEEKIPEWLERIRRRTLEDRLARENQQSDQEGLQESSQTEPIPEEDDFFKLFGAPEEPLPATTPLELAETGELSPEQPVESGIPPDREGEETSADFITFGSQDDKAEPPQAVFDWLEGLTPEEPRDDLELDKLEIPPELQSEETEPEISVEGTKEEELDFSAMPEFMETSGIEEFRAEFPDWDDEFNNKTSEESAAGEPGEISPVTPQAETGLVEEFSLGHIEDSEPAADLPLEKSPEEEVKKPEVGKKQEAEIEPGRLPGWLEAIKPIESVAPLRVPTDLDRQTEISGPLAGFQGVIPVTPLTPASPMPPRHAHKAQLTEKQRVYANLLENLVAEEAKPRSQETVKTAAPSSIFRFIVGSLLVGLLVFILASGTSFSPLPVLYPPETVAFFDILQQWTQLQNPPARILVAVDYEPGLTGEMQTIASYPIRQLLDSKASLALISTVPSGPALGQQLIEVITEDLALLPTDAHQVINLGYLVGGSTSLASLAIHPAVAAPSSLDGQFAWDSTLLQGIQSVADFDGLLVLTDNPDTARAWIEQVQPSLGGRPFLVISSAQSAPMVVPYYQSNQIQGILAGLSGGAVYEQLAQRSASQTRSYWDAYQAGILLIIIAILIGALIFSIQAVIHNQALRKRT